MRKRLELLRAVVKRSREEWVKLYTCRFCVGSHLHSCTGYDCREAVKKAEECFDRMEKKNKIIGTGGSRTMDKSSLKAVFISAKAAGAKYIGVMIETEGSSQPEIIINPKENFDIKFTYYMNAYDDELVLISAKGKKNIKITGAAHGKSFEDIQSHLLGGIAKDWKPMIADAVDKVVNKAMKTTPPENEEERLKCESMKEAIKGMFLNDSRTAAEERFIFDNIEKYEELFEICMNGDNEEFKRGLVELQRLQNEAVLRGGSDK